jgi:hypothetical protein
VIDSLRPSPRRRVRQWLTAAPRLPVRTKEVLPPSRRDEEMGVFLTAAFVVLCVIYIVGFERGGPVSAPDAAKGRGLLPYQVLFRDLPGPEQRMFRQMQEGALEAVRARAADSTWPTPEKLANDGIPPFAADPIDKSPLRWTLRNAGLFYQYVGVAAQPERSQAFMISIAEPEPATGEKPVPSVVDEEHQVLPDGTLLHVTYWKGSRDSVAPSVILEPAMDGWLQIRVKTAFEELEQS